MSRCCSPTAPSGAALSNRSPPGDRVLVGDAANASASMAWWSAAASVLDASLVTGESLPVAAEPGTPVFAGTLNLGETLTVRATATGDGTLLAECVRLIEAAEARRGRASSCSPTGWRDAMRRRCISCALLTFLWWYLGAGVAGWAGAADGERRADHHLPLRAGAGSAGGAGDRHRAAVPRRHAAEVADRAGAAGRGRHGGVRQDRHADRAARWRW